MRKQLERYWSGGIKSDPDETPSADVFVDGADIRIGISDGTNKAIIALTEDEANLLARMLQEAGMRAYNWRMQP